MTEFGSQVGDGVSVPARTVRLVGREVELGGLRELVAEVAAGRGRSVWVAGEPGIGKTALLAAGLDGVEAAGCQLFVARADETGPMFPLQVLLDALRVGPQSMDPARAEIVERLWGGPRGGLATPGDPVAAAAELLLILVDRLCAAGPVVLVVDDVQWADETSLAVWGRLGRSVAQLPLLLVAAARPVPRREEIERLRRGLAGADQVDLALSGLDPDQVSAVVQALVSVPAGPGLRALVGQAGGNPLYLRELVDALTREGRIVLRGGLADIADIADIAAEPQPAPQSLAAAINARLNFVSEPARRVLRTAALLGAEFRVEHLSALTGRPVTSLTDPLDEALAGGVLVESGPALAFRHGLIHQALYQSTPAAMRSALHQQAARSLAAAGARPETVAAQLLSVPDPADDWTAEWLTDAAPALITRAPHVAVDLLQSARHTIDSIDARRIQLDAHLIDALTRLGRHEDVEALARTALARAQDPDITGRMTWALVYALVALGQYEEAMTVSGQAIAKPATSIRWQVRLRAWHAYLLFVNARYDEAPNAAEQAEMAGQRAGDRVAVARALHAAAQLQEFHHMDQTAALRLRERASAVLGDDPEDTDLRLLLLCNRAIALANLGRRTEATQLLGQALDLGERTATPQRLADLRSVAAHFSFWDGRWDVAVAELDAALDGPMRPLARLSLRGLAALIAFHRDDQEAMQASLDSSENTAVPPGYMIYADRLLVAQARAAERDGRPEQGLAILLELLDPESTLQFSPLKGFLWMIDTVRLALAAGNKTVAEAAVRACSAEAKRQSLPDALASADHCRGLVDADPTLLLAAAETFHNLGHVHFQARTLEDAAVVLAQRGDSIAARAAYTDAVQIYTDLDAHWDLRRSDARMRPLGIRRGVSGPRRRPTTGWDALTPTETKVANLIAAGKPTPTSQPICTCPDEPCTPTSPTYSKSSTPAPASTSPAKP